MQSNYEEKKDSDGEMGHLNNGKATEVEKRKPKQKIVDGNWVSFSMCFVDKYMNCISCIFV